MDILLLLVLAGLLKSTILFLLSPSKYRVKNILQPTVQKEKALKPLYIQYISSKIIEVKKVKLNDEKLNEIYKAFINQNNPTITFGFYLDMPFHVPLDRCRYYIGIGQTPYKKTTQVLTMPAGYYTSISIIGNFSTFKEKLFNLRSQIENNGYSIDSLIGYEKIILPEEILDFDYFQIKRELLIKIKRK